MTLRIRAAALGIGLASAAFVPAQAAAQTTVVSQVTTSAYYNRAQRGLNDLHAARALIYLPTARADWNREHQAALVEIDESIKWMTIALNVSGKGKYYLPDSVTDSTNASDRLQRAVALLISARKDTEEAMRDSTGTIHVDLAQARYAMMRSESRVGELIRMEQGGATPTPPPAYSRGQRALNDLRAARALVYLPTSRADWNRYQSGVLSEVDESIKWTGMAINVSTHGAYYMPDTITDDVSGANRLDRALGLLISARTDIETAMSGSSGTTRSDFAQARYNIMHAESRLHELMHIEAVETTH